MKETDKLLLSMLKDLLRANRWSSGITATIVFAFSQGFFDSAIIAAIVTIIFVAAFTEISLWQFEKTTTKGWLSNKNKF